MSEQSLSKLSEALVAASAEMPAIGFDETNPFLKNRFASLGSVIATVRPILAKHGLAIMQFACSDEQGRVGVRTRLLHSSGEWLEESIYLDVTEEKGKSRAQVAGSIITYLRRYAQSALLNLYADEDTDGNAPRGDSAHSVSRPSSTPATPPKVATAAPGAQGGAKGSAPPTQSPDEKKALACKARFLKVIAEKQWAIYAWLYAVSEGWIMDNERLEDARPEVFPASVDGFAKVETAIKQMLNDAAAHGGISQEEQEAYDQVHYEPSDNDGGSSQVDDSWKDIAIPKWSKHFKEDGLSTFGDLDSKQLWWWCVKWKPTGFQGRLPKAEDMELRSQLDNVRRLMNFTE